MDVAALAASFVAARTAQVQLAAAAAMMRMEAQQEASVASLVAAAAENAQQLADAASGLGTSLDITV